MSFGNMHPTALIYLTFHMIEEIKSIAWSLMSLVLLLVEIIIKRIFRKHTMEGQSICRQRKKTVMVEKIKERKNSIIPIISQDPILPNSHGNVHLSVRRKTPLKLRGDKLRYIMCLKHLPKNGNLVIVNSRQRQGIIDMFLKIPNQTNVPTKHNLIRKIKKQSLVFDYRKNQIILQLPPGRPPEILLDT